ncbi:pentapeptide repeat-containing protein [Caulobacter sp. Root343]|uniref:anti-phage Hailong system effector protein HalA n=1 Tax=Caulobacter sp. Root343 TaxID=1736520 RepID=UPI0006F4D5EE|nr:pentapeptide repeat-containing protein [Caulobacter sp. Root343]KQV64090.1 hypothetical protein ASC70_19910 [Caulobacter sp. Root343]
MLRRFLDRLLDRAPAVTRTNDPVAALVPPTKIAGHLGDRRATNFWEPIFGPEVQMAEEPYDWDVGRDSGPTRRFCQGGLLTKKVEAGETLKIKDVTFKECDFQGPFNATAIVVFDNCRFIGCDFAYSEWTSAHFKNCGFIGTSLAMATFEKCEFRGCTWERIGVSGNKTDFVRTFIENPKAMIAAMYSGQDPSKGSSKDHACYQWYRLAGTRAHVLRNIMLSHANVGDEHVYYRTVGLHELQRNLARLGEDWYNIRYKTGSRRWKAIRGAPFHALNLALMWIFGLTNSWGESVSRPSVLFAAIYVIFGAVYAFSPFSPSVDHPWQKSFDITLLIGFTNHGTAPWPLSVVQEIHGLFAVALYTVFFSTLISKLSRTR